MLKRAPSSPPAGADALAGAVRQAWARFRGTILARVDAVEAAAAAARESGLDETVRRHAEREAHKLAGSVGTFGFARASALAREAEALLEGTAPLSEVEARVLSGLAAELRRELDRPAGAADAPSVPHETAAAPEPGTATSEEVSSAPLLLMVGLDADLDERVGLEAAGRGIRTRTAAGVAEGRALAAGEPPACVLLDLSADRDGAGLELIAELSAGAPRVPVVVVSARDSFADRVDVARMGGLGFVQKPVTPVAVLDAVQRVLQRERRADACVLLVDDDAVVLAEAARLLEAGGVTAHTLADPLGLWEALEEHVPEVVVLDVDMPGVNGIELCRVMRNDPRWASTPVVFLTSSTGAETVQRVFAAGADDFVAKPIVGPELVTRITNRLERVRLHRALADTDPLTGVANRRRSDELMQQLLHLAARQAQPLSLAVIDLDFFKQVNDRHGHGTGDEVLRRVARLLERSFRAEDVVARWGGEEFVVAMYGMDRDDGVQRLAEVLEVLRGDRFEAPGTDPFQVTFSGGVAQFPLDGVELGALYRAADAALYQAKAAGRDRVLPTGRASDADEPSEVVDVLVVEGDATLARRLLHALETRGYLTRWIESGGEVAQLLAGTRPPLRARVVLLDVDLPGMDGHALLHALARDKVLERTRVIALVRGLHEEAEGKQWQAEGAFDHVAKPFGVPTLLQRVRRAMRA